ncbi:hepatocyte growth factor receptor-like [Haliotis rubra]|uniref:hepatocyte growth factor receptor-like n=1 Tax=Haliotis rubra TaxID=36100 RepID=UPI001EE5DCDE|nr:hepatocyte growth factor receptor-like [Haliotis rubra]
MVYCRESGFSLLVSVFSLSIAAGLCPFWNDSIDDVIRDPKTGHVYTAGDKGISHWSENLTFISCVGWGGGERDRDAVMAMALHPGSPRLLACSTARDGLCAVYNTLNITQRQWMNNGTNDSYINSRSVLLFLGNVTVIVASSITGTSTSPVPVLSYRRLSLPEQGTPSMNISNNQSVTSRTTGKYDLKFISGFTKENFTYLLTTQNETSNVSTRLIMFCTSDSSLLPVVDMLLSCRTMDHTTFNLGLAMADTGSSITVSFGRNANGTEFVKDPSLGSVLCQYRFDHLKKVGSDALELKTSENVTWADVICNPKVDGEAKQSMCQPGQSQGACKIQEHDNLLNKLPPEKFNSVYRNKTTVIATVLSSEDGKVIVATSDGDLLQFTNASDGNLTLSGDVSDSFPPHSIVVRDRKDSLRLFDTKMKEVDICEGKRCEECSRTLRCGWCKGCMFREACVNNTCKVQTWYPQKGPKSGGTVITFEGCGFNTTDSRYEQIKVACSKCNKLENNSSTTMQCKVEKLNCGDNTNVQTGVVTKVEFPDCTLGNFTIKPDPNIADVFPKSSIQSGGLTITVVGKNFDVIQQPRIAITVLNKTENGNCATNGTTGKVLCETPFFPLEKQNETTGTLRVIMDAVTRDFNFTIYPDPVLPTLGGKLFQGSKLNIHAKLDGVNETDVRVEIGRSNCTDVHFNGTLISCMPDWTVREKTRQNITVKVGRNLTLDAGYVVFVIHGPPSNHDVIIGSVVTLAIIIIIVVAGAAVCVKEYKSALHSRLQSELTSTTADDRVLNTYFLLEPRVKETLSPELMQRIEQNKVIVPFSRLQLRATIGSGNFGCVYEGLLYAEDDHEDGGEKVAIKTMQDNSQNMDLASFVEEALVMKGFDHENVLRLLGISVNQSQQPMVILPFMANGDLMSFVSKDEKEVRVFDILRWGVDIAEGMNYLSSLKLVHRDLAARNCMLDDNLRVKVADFGLCRDIYEKGYYTSDNKKKLPIRWMAPESMERGSYSSKSDVWSLGVVLWEMLTRGATPYPGVEVWDIARYLQYGRRLQQPWFCSNEL